MQGKISYNVMEITLKCNLMETVAEIILRN